MKREGKKGVSKNNKEETKNNKEETKNNKQENKRDKKRLSIKQRIYNLYNNNRVSFIASIILIFIFLLIIFLKTYLYINLLLGNDVLINLESDNYDLSLLNGETSNISIDASITANPFCKVRCNYTFSYMGSSNVIDSNLIYLKSLSPFSKSYEIKANKFGEGKDFYRFDIECTGIKTLLCDTKDLPVRRSLIITLDYRINPEEVKLRESLRYRIENVSMDLGVINHTFSEFSNILNEMNKTVIADTLYIKMDSFKENLSKMFETFYDIEHYWYIQDYYRLEQILNEFDLSNFGFYNLNYSLAKNIEVYNRILYNLSLIKEDLNYIKYNSLYLNKSDEVNQIIDNYNELLMEIENRDYVFNKERLVAEFLQYNDINSLKDEIRRKDPENRLNLLLKYNALCYINGVCFEYYSFDEIGNYNDYNIRDSCDKINDLKDYYIELNNSINITNYPDSIDFWDNITIKVENIKINISNNYLDLISDNPNYLNYFIIIDILNISNNSQIRYSEDYNYNITDALLYKLIEQEQELNQCSFNNDTIKDINKTPNILEFKFNYSYLSFKFDEQYSRCCIYNKCSKCCSECYNQDYPIIFLHGHNFNKDLIADYSLDAFDMMQKNLEKEGYIDGGVLIYNLDNNNLGFVNYSWSFRTSYYFDAFKELDDYSRIQTKNEKIDSYSIRLDEIIKEVKSKTSKDKVIIIAHSMGGLVSRRYLQIFGNKDVYKLILIGTPNQGIEGDISKLCPVFGEELECGDMNKNSLFINKLNNQDLSNIMVYNLVGVGCNMNLGNGDGIVLEKNAFLEGTDNIYVNGTCTSLNKFHSDMLNTDKYPEIYEVILNSLKQDNLTL